MCFLTFLQPCSDARQNLRSPLASHRQQEGVDSHSLRREVLFILFVSSGDGTRFWVRWVGIFQVRAELFFLFYVPLSSQEQEQAPAEVTSVEAKRLLKFPAHREIDFYGSFINFPFLPVLRTHFRWMGSLIAASRSAAFIAPHPPTRRRLETFVRHVTFWGEAGCTQNTRSTLVPPPRGEILHFVALETNNKSSTNGFSLRRHHASSRTSHFTSSLTGVGGNRVHGRVCMFVHLWDDEIFPYPRGDV